MSEPQHPALEASVEDRIDYLIAVASMAFADGTTDKSELIKVSELCAELGVSGDGAQRVSAAASVPNRDQVERILGRFRQSHLRVTLLIDALVIAYADEHVDKGEVAEIARFAHALDLDTAQAVLIGRYVEETIRGQGSDTLSHELADQLSHLTAKVPPQGVVRSLFNRLRGQA
jgi:uncharacterized tellurite resistance protein B-like protein